MILFITGLLGGIALGVVGTIGVLIWVIRDIDPFPV